MKLSSDDIDALCKLAIEAAMSAGKLINSYLNRHVKTLKKKTGSSHAAQIVTEVDFKSQELILEILKPSIKQFDLAILTEESPDTKNRLEKDFFWCIDPLDGTLPFSESSYGYAVSIALVSAKGESHIGVICDPEKGSLYHAILNKGAYKNNALWSFKDDSKTRPFQFYHNRSFKKLAIFPKVLKELEKLSINISVHGIQVYGTYGAAINACLVLENIPSCYFAFPKKEDGGGSIWDYAATACIYKEIGGSVTDIFGDALDLNNPESTFMNTNGILYASDEYISKMIQDIYTNLKST